MTTDAIEALLTPRQFADRCGVDEKTVRRWCRAGKLAGAFVTPGGVCWKIPEAALPAERRAEPSVSQREWNRRAAADLAALEAM